MLVIPEVDLDNKQLEEKVVKIRTEKEDVKAKIDVLKNQLFELIVKDIVLTGILEITY